MRRVSRWTLWTAAIACLLALPMSQRTLDDSERVVSTRSESRRPPPIVEPVATPQSAPTVSVLPISTAPGGSEGVSGAGLSWLIATALGFAPPGFQVPREILWVRTVVEPPAPSIDGSPRGPVPSVYLPARRVSDGDITLERGLVSARPWQDREIRLVDRAWLVDIPDQPFRLPARIAEDFETTLCGLTPPPAGALLEGRGDALGVVERARPDGSQRSLRIAGTSQTGSRLHPYLYYRPGHEEGTSLCRFDLRVERAGCVRVEWWEETGESLPGPSITVRDGAALVGGRRILEVPAETWVTVEMEAPLGRLADGTWSVRIASSGGGARAVGGLAVGHASWRRLDVVAFLAVPTRGGGALIDNVEVRNAPVGPRD